MRPHSLFSTVQGVLLRIHHTYTHNPPIIFLISSFLLRLLPSSVFPAPHHPPVFSSHAQTILPLSTSTRCPTMSAVLPRSSPCPPLSLPCRIQHGLSEILFIYLNPVEFVNFVCISPFGISKYTSANGVVTFVGHQNGAFN